MDDDDLGAYIALSKAAWIVTIDFIPLVKTKSLYC